MSSADSSLPGRKIRFEGGLLSLCLAVLVLGSALAMQAAWRWPLVGDSALIRYVVFLLHAGRTPYTQVVDINLPGSYLLEALAMKCFGWDAIGLRLYDGFLCVAFCGLAYLVPGEGQRERLGCLCGGLLFLLIHLQDGLTEAGQRDLALALLMLAAVVTLARGRRRPLLAVACFELLVGFGLTVKPTIWLIVFLPLLLFQNEVDGFPALGARASKTKAVVLGLVGLLIAPAVALGWLVRMGSVHAFVRMARTIGVLHGELGRHDVGFLLAHCMAPVGVLFLLWLGVLATRVLPFDETRRLLLGAVACGLVSYLGQGKGLSYQRYPFLGLMLVLIGLDVARASRLRGAAYVLAMLIVGCVTLWFAPRFTVAVRSFDTTQPFEDHLARSLRARPGSVQCLDTFGGCIDTLYQMRTLQATGYLYDCYLFSLPSASRAIYRREFLESFLAARPETIVLTNQPCFELDKSYDRLTRWPEFEQLLDHEYRLQEEWHTDTTYRWWSRWERPIAYRIYGRR